MHSASPVLVTAAVFFGLLTSVLCTPLPAGTPSPPESPPRDSSRSPKRNEEPFSLPLYDQDLHHLHQAIGESSRMEEGGSSHEHQYPVGNIDQQNYPFPPPWQPKETLLQKLQRAQSMKFPPPTNPSSSFYSKMDKSSPRRHKDLQQGTLWAGRNPFHRSYSDSPRTLQRLEQANDGNVDLTLTLGGGHHPYHSSSSGSAITEDKEIDEASHKKQTFDPSGNFKLPAKRAKHVTFESSSHNAPTYLTLDDIARHLPASLVRDTDLADQGISPAARNSMTRDGQTFHQTEAQASDTDSAHHRPISHPSPSLLPSDFPTNSAGMTEATLPQESNAVVEPSDEEVEEFYALLRNIKPAVDYFKKQQEDHDKHTRRRRRRRDPEDPAGDKRGDGGGGGSDHGPGSVEN